MSVELDLIARLRGWLGNVHTLKSRLASRSRAETFMPGSLAPELLRRSEEMCDEVIDRERETADALTRLSQQVADAENRASIAEEARSKLMEENLAQARRIEQQALEYVSLFDQCSEALEKVAALESPLAARDAEPFTYYYELHAETGEVIREDFYATKSDIPFGRPGKDFSESFTVTETPLYDHPPAAAASEDAKRLDYMEVVGPITFCPEAKGDMWEIYPDANSSSSFSGKTLREALDLAIASQKEQKE